MTDMPFHEDQLRGKIYIRKYFLDRLKDYRGLADLFAGKGFLYFRLYSLYPFEKYLLVDLSSCYLGSRSQP